MPPRASSALDEGAGAAEMLGIRRHGVGEQHVHGVVEADHVEAVGGLQAAERVDQARFACTIEVPPIEPELSITKITSRGNGFCSACSSVGGVMKASR